MYFPVKDVYSAAVESSCSDPCHCFNVAKACVARNWKALNRPFLWNLASSFCLVLSISSNAFVCNVYLDFAFSVYISADHLVA